MTSQHIIYEITCTVLMTSLPWYLTLHPLYLCHHNHPIDDLRLTVCMISHHCSHHIHWIHGTSHTIYDITHMTTQTLYLPSHPLYLTLHPLYVCHQTQCINYTTPTLWMTSHTLYVWHHNQYAWHHMHSLWHHTPMCMPSHPVYLWHHIQYIWYHAYCFHDNTTSLPDISPTKFDTTATVSVSSQRWQTHLSGCIPVSMTSQQVWKS